jgi:hypothetical protein
VRDLVADQIEKSGINYLLCRLAFGSLSHEQSARSIELFGEQVMPRVKRAA